MLSPSLSPPICLSLPLPFSLSRPLSLSPSRCPSVCLFLRPSLSRCFSVAARVARSLSRSTFSVPLCPTPRRLLSLAPFFPRFQRHFSRDAYAIRYTTRSADRLGIAVHPRRTLLAQRARSIDRPARRSYSRAQPRELSVSVSGHATCAAVCIYSGIAAKSSACHRRRTCGARDIPWDSANDTVESCFSGDKPG